MAAKARQEPLRILGRKVSAAMPANCSYRNLSIASPPPHQLVSLVLNCFANSGTYRYFRCSLVFR